MLICSDKIVFMKKIGILGYGTVGKQVYEQIKDKAEVVKILDVRMKGELFTESIDELLAYDIDTVFECLPNIEIAFEYQKKVLQKGIDLISSNKAVVKKYYEELVKLSNENNCHFSFEAAVGGGIPNLHTLLDMKKHDEITYVKGIMNGTTNYILDNVFNKGMSYETALNKAIELGYAEADYSSDVDGVDVAYKIALSLSLAYDCNVDIKDMQVFGIRYLDDRAIEYAKSNGYVIKLIGYGDKDNAYVLPRFIKKEEVLANIAMNYNCIEIGSKNQESIKLIGQGAGGVPTADALISDFYRPFDKLSIDNDLVIKNDMVCKVYIDGEISKMKISDIEKRGCFIGIVE